MINCCWITPTLKWLRISKHLIGSFVPVCILFRLLCLQLSHFQYILSSICIVHALNCISSFVYLLIDESIKSFGLITLAVPMVNWQTMLYKVNLTSKILNSIIKWPIRHVWVLLTGHMTLCLVACFIQVLILSKMDRSICLLGVSWVFIFKLLFNNLRRNLTSRWHVKIFISRQITGAFTFLF